MGYSPNSYTHSDFLAAKRLGFTVGLCPCPACRKNYEILGVCRLCGLWVIKDPTGEYYQKHIGWTRPEQTWHDSDLISEADYLASLC